MYRSTGDPLRDAFPILRHVEAILPWNQVVTLPWGCGSGLSPMVLSHGPGPIQTSLCRGHDLSELSLDPDTPSCVEGEAAQKALGLCRPRYWRGGGGERPAARRHRATVDFLAPDTATSAGGGRWERLSSPRGAEEVGGRQGAPALQLCRTDGTGFLPMMEYLCMLLIEPEK